MDRLAKHLIAAHWEYFSLPDEIAAQPLCRGSSGGQSPTGNYARDSWASIIDGLWTANTKSYTRQLQEERLEIEETVCMENRR